MSLWNVGFSESPAGVNLPGLTHKVETPESTYLFNSSVTFRLRGSGVTAWNTCAVSGATMAETSAEDEASEPTCG